MIKAEVKYKFGTHERVAVTHSFTNNDLQAARAFVEAKWITLSANSYKYKDMSTVIEYKLGVVVTINYQKV